MSKEDLHFTILHIALLQNIVDYILQYIFIIIICESQKVSEIDL
jgi:hypothetical protein